MKALALVVGLVGCWRDPPPVAPEPPPPPETATIARPRVRHTPCELAIDHALEVTRDQLDPAIMANMDRSRANLVASCAEMGWSPAVIQCLQDLPTTEDIAACRDQMTPDQIADVLRRIGE